MPATPARTAGGSSRPSSTSPLRPGITTSVIPASSHSTPARPIAVSKTCIRSDATGAWRRLLRQPPAPAQRGERGAAEQQQAGGGEAGADLLFSFLVPMREPSVS